MLQLDSPVAQSIVDRAMSIIRCNVHVMNPRGIITASGEPSRIGSPHDGALLLLAQSCTAMPAQPRRRRTDQSVFHAFPGLRTRFDTYQPVQGCP